MYYGPDSQLIKWYADQLADIWPLVMSEFQIKHPPVVRLASLRKFGMFGVCYGWDRKTPSLIIMDMNAEKLQGFDTFLQDLCHEMTHAEQWARGDLVKRGKKYFWKDTPLPDTQAALNSLDEETYKKLPWEAEAYAREVLAYESIVAQMHF